MKARLTTVLITLLIVSCGGDPRPNNTGPVTSGPKFLLRSFAGGGCAPCKKELPILSAALASDPVLKERVVAELYVTSRTLDPKDIPSDSFVADFQKQFAPAFTAKADPKYALFKKEVHKTDLQLPADVIYDAAGKKLKLFHQPAATAEQILTYLRSNIGG